MDTTSQKIKKIFDDNKINDLTRFIEKRQAINYCNIRLRYVYYTFHYSSILVTTIAVGFHENHFQKNDMVNMVWLGIGLNILSTLIHAFEKMNRNVSKKILANINKIKSGEYVDETELLDSINESSIKSNQNNNRTVIPL